MNLFKKEIKRPEPKNLPTPFLKLIPIKEIKFAPYQRELKAAKVNKIIDNFIPEIVGVALVSFRNGEYWCMDSQHRIKALEKMGYEDIWAMVVTDLTYEQECHRFNILNTGRTQLNSNQVFHCKVEEGDPIALSLVKLFAKYKYDYNKNGSIKDTNVIGSVSQFERIYKRYGVGTVERVLNVLRNAWCGEKESLASAIIAGIATFFNEQPDADDGIVINALGHIAPEELIASATAFMKFGILKPSRSDGACYHIAKQIKELYDSETRPRRRRKVGEDIA